MLRPNYDISQMRQLPVEIIGRGNNNYVRVRLPSHDNVECELGLKKSTQRGTEGEHGASAPSRTNTATSGSSWKRSTTPKRAKTSKWTLKKMQEAHLDLMNLLVKEEQTKLDIVFDQVGDVQVITAAKGNQFTASAVRPIAPVPRNLLYLCFGDIPTAAPHKPSKYSDFRAKYKQMAHVY